MCVFPLLVIILCLLDFDWVEQDSELFIFLSSFQSLKPSLTLGFDLDWFLDCLQAALLVRLLHRLIPFLFYLAHRYNFLAKPFRLLDFLLQLELFLIQQVHSAFELAQISKTLIFRVVQRLLHLFERQLVWAQIVQLWHKVQRFCDATVIESVSLIARRCRFCGTDNW